MRKKQKINKKKKSQRSYKDFISLVKWHKNKFDVLSYISNIYENGDKKEVVVYLILSSNVCKQVNLKQKHFH